MARAMNCDGPDGGPAQYVVSMIEAAEVAAFCGACFADFCQAYLQATDPSRLAPPPAPRARKTRPQAAPAVADDKGGEKTDGKLASTEKRPAARVGNSKGDRGRAS